jgi:hypothetical protein
VELQCITHGENCRSFKAQNFLHQPRQPLRSYTLRKASAPALDLLLCILQMRTSQTGGLQLMRIDASGPAHTVSS